MLVKDCNTHHSLWVNIYHGYVNKPVLFQEDNLVSLNFSLSFVKVDKHSMIIFFHLPFAIFIFSRHFSRLRHSDGSEPSALCYLETHWRYYAN